MIEGEKPASRGTSRDRTGASTPRPATLSDPIGALNPPSDGAPRRIIAEAPATSAPGATESSLIIALVKDPGYYAAVLSAAAEAYTSLDVTLALGYATCPVVLRASFRSQLRTRCEPRVVGVPVARMDCRSIGASSSSLIPAR